jgi:hypothetical protein
MTGKSHHFLRTLIVRPHFLGETHVDSFPELELMVERSVERLQRKSTRRCRLWLAKASGHARLYA